MIIKDDYKEPNIFDEMQPGHMTLKQLKSIYTANSDIQTGTEATIVAAGQAFKQNLKETIFSGLPATMGQLAYKTGEKIEETAQIWKERFFDEDNQISPNGGEVFNGNTLVEIGKSLQESGKINIRTANRNLQMLRDDFRKNAIPISREEQDSLLFSVASQALDYPVQLGLAYLNPTLSIGYMAARVLGGETVEGMDKYTEEMGDIVGFEQKSGKELGLNVANAVVQSIWERAFGAPAQLRNFMNSKGMLKLFGRGFTDEFATENLQNLTDAVFDEISDRLAKNETVASRLAQNFRDTVVAGVFGGASGTAFAIHNRSKGIEDIANNLLGESVPANERQAVATAIYENGVNTLQGLITAELETSSSLRAHHGEVYQAMFDNVLKAVRDAKQIGAFATLQENELARYANTEAKRFADQVLAEATMRKQPVTEVFSASDVAYENGKLSLRINGVSTEISGQDVAQGILEQAMYRSPLKTFGEFYDDVFNEPTKKARYYRQKSPNGVDYDILSDTVRHDKNKHALSKEEWQEVNANIDDIESSVLSSRKGFYGIPVLIKLDVNGKKYGLTIEHNPSNGRNFITTAFTDSEKAIDKWISDEVKKKERQEMSSDPTSSMDEIQSVAHLGNSLSDIISSLDNNVNSLLQQRALFQESLDIANQNAELDANNPAYEGETINIDGVERTVYNSNGDRIAMSEPALRNFYKWFGDSKVVDEQGRPLVVAHSTDAIFDAFDINKAGESGDAGWLGTGFYFFGDRSLDNQYGKYVMPVYLKIENPYYATYEEKSELADINDKTASDDFRDKLVDGGYDGVYYNADLNQEWVAFNSNQIKSTSNRGTYSESDNIYYQSANASIELLGDKALISLFEKADAHSLPHELAHYWLDAMFKYVKSGNATPEYMERWNAIAKHLGIKANQERLTRRQQEIWASGYETYLNTQLPPVPILRGVFDDYNRWLRRVYRELKTNPTFTSNDGKKHTIRLSDEMIRVFNSMTTGEFIARPDVERMATKVTPKLEKAVVELENKGVAEIQKMENATTYPSTVIKPTKAIRGMVRGEADEDPDNSVNVSSVAMRELGEAFGYQKKNLAEEYAKAEAWVRGNLARAKEVVYGKVAPDGLLSTAINIAYVREMENMGNYVEAQKATRVRSFEQTLRGQEISMERVTTDDALSMSYWTGKVLARKEHAVASRFFKNDIQALRKFIDKESKALAHEIKGKPEDEKKMIIAKKLQELSKQYGSTTLYQMNEDLPDTYDQLYIITRSLIEDSVGINITDEQTNEISGNVDRMKKMFENTASKNGNPSIETFKKLDEMNKLIDSYAPTNQGVVWSSIYGRSAMLASVKSPITNIVSNVENFITEKLARIGMNIINGQTNDNLVSSDRIKDYIKWNDDVYAASGYMPTITENIFEETPKTLGESRPHSQGKGIVRQVGRIAENAIFKQLMGRPDNFAKGLVFTDVAGNRATQIAYEEGLTGEDAVLRANELFDDAVLLNPKTEEGQQIRKQAMESAHQTTYTQDSKLAQVALRIREVLNTVGGKNWKMGDMLMPFVRTPANVVSAGLDYAIGSVYTLYNVKEIIQNPKSEVAQKAIRSAVRNGEGILLALLISAFLDEDDYIPEFANLSPKMREMVKLQGGVYNSIRLFGHWVSLDYFGTLGIPLAGIMKARQRENLFNSLFAYGQGTVEQLLKVPGFREAADVIGSIQEIGAYDKKPEEVWKEVFDWTTDQAYTRTVPAFVNDIGKFLDTYERETDREMLKRIQSKIPFLREQLPAKTSIATGGKVKSEGWKALLFGSRVSEDNDNRLVNEVEKLMKQENMPSVSDPTRYGKLKDLPVDKKNQARAYFNAQYAREVKKIMSKSGYNRMKPEEKKKAFDKVRRELTEKLKERYKLK